ncbi:T9SS type A sorting domain-containing protein [bacterium AH-315-F03]|nr:T9SS type A sorting domain-containing protein [bacterium AH-315-F03]
MKYARLLAKTMLSLILFGTCTWATEVSLRLVDQNGALIPASTFKIDGNDLSQEEGITLATGIYTVRLLPGLHGSNNNGNLCRDETITVTGSSQTIEFTWQTAELSVDLLDQYGVPIPASRASVGSSFPRESLPFTFVLPVTTDPNETPVNCLWTSGYRINFYPGLAGVAEGGLGREEKDLSLATAGASYTFVWETATLTFIDLVDQNGNSIPASRARLNPVHPALGLLFPISVVLPVTDIYPDFSTFASGYIFTLYPGVNNSQNVNDVYRFEPLELSLGGTSYIHEWNMADVAVHLVDQNGAPIPNSQVALPRGSAGYEVIAAGSPMRLPVTEDPTHAEINGASRNGYDVRLMPGLNGLLQSGLFRDNEDLPELWVTGLDYTFEWIQLECPITLVDETEAVIPGSHVEFPGITGALSNGDHVVLPITDSDVYPKLAHPLVNGYLTKLSPGGTPVGQRVFKITSALEFSPAFDTLDDGNIYGLRCGQPVQLRLVDQFGVLIPASQFVVRTVATVPQGGVLPLPAGAYDIDLYPGLNGFEQFGDLSHKKTVTVDETTSTLEFVWPTAEFAFDLVDQHGDTIRPSEGSVAGTPFPSSVLLPLAVNLPVTEDASLLNIQGKNTNGYKVGLFPAINGNRQNGFLRIEGDFELSVSGFDSTFEWLMLECQVAIVDASENVLPNATIQNVGGYPGTFANGDTILLPITDNVFYSDLQGSNAAGHPIAIAPEGGLAIGTGFFEIDSLLEIQPEFVELVGNNYGLRCIPPVGDVAGNVSSDCPTPGTVLLGVSVDAFDGEGFLVSTAVTDAAGNYQIDDLVSGDHTITIVTPLGYSATSDEIPVTVVGGGIVLADFALSCVAITANPRTIGFWKHQVGVGLGGNGNSQIDANTLCGYLDLIEVHYNSNAINQVVVYEPPVSGDCSDKLAVAKELLNLKGNVGMTSRAKQQLTALLLNVASGKISLTEIISVDGATVSQAITYSDNLIDDLAGDHETAKTICDEINNNRQVAAGVIPLTTVYIAYKTGVLPEEFRLNQNHPNPFNPSTKISLSLPEATNWEITIYNIQGQRVRTYSGQSEPGVVTIDWDGSDFASGVYFYKATAGFFTATRKMVMLK